VRGLRARASGVIRHLSEKRTDNWELDVHNWISRVHVAQPTDLAASGAATESKRHVKEEAVLGGRCALGAGGFQSQIDGLARGKYCGGVATALHVARIGTLRDGLARVQESLETLVAQSRSQLQLFGLVGSGGRRGRDGRVAVGSCGRCGCARRAKR